MTSGLKACILFIIFVAHCYDGSLNIKYQTDNTEKHSNTLKDFILFFRYLIFKSVDICVSMWGFEHVSALPLETR